MFHISENQAGFLPLAKAGNKSNHKTLINSNATCHIRRFIFERHREGGSCNAKHIQDLLEQKFDLKVDLRSVQRNLNRLGFESAILILDFEQKKFFHLVKTNVKFSFKFNL